jgi:curved DNA-binding protein
MEFKDYYQTLGIEQSASDAEIKTAYRRLARKFHPDVSKEKSAEDRFKSINEAYEVLKDKQKRTQYDQLKTNGYRSGQEYRAPQGFNRGQSQYDFGSENAAGGFSDFFESLFGNTRRTQTQQPIHNSKVKLSIPLELAYTGGKQKIRINSRILEVNIPVGIRSGQSIRLAGQGEQQGDLMIEIDYLEHPEFELEGQNILYTLTLMPWQAALGALVFVPTLGGMVELNIPANSDTGKRLRLKGRGIPGKSVKGDQLVVLEVSAPKAKTEEQKAFYQQMQEIFEDN